jgi:hypothetical protein
VMEKIGIKHPKPTVNIADIRRKYHAQAYGNVDHHEQNS